MPATSHCSARQLSGHREVIISVTIRCPRVEAVRGGYSCLEVLKLTSGLTRGRWKSTGPRPRRTSGRLTDPATAATVIDAAQPPASQPTYQATTAVVNHAGLGSRRLWLATTTTTS